MEWVVRMVLARREGMADGDGAGRGVWNEGMEKEAEEEKSHRRLSRKRVRRMLMDSKPRLCATDRKVPWKGRQME